MERFGPSLKALLAFGLAVHIHHKIEGPPADYVGLALAAAASWAGLPGPGEPVLIALAIFAARHNFDITSVVVIAWLAAAAGGVIGWVVGLNGGRRLLSARGPLLRMRLNALDRGDQVFRRHPVLGILLTPAWIAGIHRVPTGRYLTINVLSAALWAAGIGFGAYLVGPPIVDLVGDMGVVATVALGVLVFGSFAAEVIRRRRRRAREAATTAREP